MPNSAAATEQPGSPVIHIIREHRGLAEHIASADFDLFSNIFTISVLHVMLKHYLYSVSVMATLQ